MILETGFRKGLPLLVIADKESLKSALRDHHTLTKIKPEVDQFMDGLKEVGVLDMIRKYPVLMSKLFVREDQKKIDKSTPAILTYEILFFLFCCFFFYRILQVSPYCFFF